MASTRQRSITAAEAANYYCVPFDSVANLVIKDITYRPWLHPPIHRGEAEAPPSAGYVFEVRKMFKFRLEQIVDTATALITSVLTGESFTVATDQLVAWGEYGMSTFVPRYPSLPHGTCRTCSGPISTQDWIAIIVPCGWVSDTEWTQQQLEKEQFNSKTKRRTRS